MAEEKKKKKLVVLSGAGISKESGIPTFRDCAEGLWNNYDVASVCQAGCLEKNEDNVHKFYNELREQYKDCEPNNAHKRLHDLEKDYDVYIITQNVDNLHEKAGSSNVIHLHGELMKCRAYDDDNLIYDIPEIDGKYETNADMEIEGHKVRPHVVFFGEGVYNLGEASNLASEADVFLIIGTSLAVYPAAGLVEYVQYGKPIFNIDPNASIHPFYPDATLIREPATKGIETFIEKLKQYEIENI